MGPPRSRTILRKVSLQPVVLHLQGREHQVLFALEVLVESGLADADVGQHLVDADTSKSIAVEATDRPLRPAVDGLELSWRFPRELIEVYHKSTGQCTTSQLGRAWTANDTYHTRASDPFVSPCVSDWNPVFAEDNDMKRWLFLAYGVAGHATFLATYAYMAGFVGNLFVPKSIDAPAGVDTAKAVAINLLLVAMFAVQHSVMARPAFKRLWTRIGPATH